MRELKFYVRLSYIFFYADAWIDYLSCFLNEHFAKLDFLDKSIKNKALDK